MIRKSYTTDLYLNRKNIKLVAFLIEFTDEFIFDWSEFSESEH